ncbi:Chemotaxis protein CheY [Defluviimonas aquaemixtae]|uniref:Chemotaxis protein CheY n=1 Tax=Albidovulum aquaemixtae TaxID=1542388 RepID=A0A2R8B5V2_9RHOB|nr:response regulator [Defluviimonas aquaemixtae]SPH17913.1 Chemotaxis protein CheY [Defluviimonas aquaemixtae]
MPFDFRNLSVLVVEDTAPLRRMVESILDTMGVGTIYSAADGQTGYEKFKRCNPDIVLADWHMAPVNGIELTRVIRNDQMSPNRMVPVILVTGYSAIERVSEARDSGITEFMVKPFSANDLAKRLAYVINRPRDFIDCSDYFGPDRRRKTDAGYNGPLRREADN